jgi:hypothetical protein
MRILLRKTSRTFCAAALVLAPAAVTPAAAAGGGPTNAGGFNSPGDFGAHFSTGESSAPGDFAGYNGARRYGRRFRGGYPAYYGETNCNPAFAVNPRMCR